MMAYFAVAEADPVIVISLTMLEASVRLHEYVLLSVDGRLSWTSIEKTYSVTSAASSSVSQSQSNWQLYCGSRSLLAHTRLANNSPQEVACHEHLSPAAYWLQVRRCDRVRGELDDPASTAAC